MPHFEIQGDTDLFETADEIDVNGDIACHSFVTAEKTADNTVVISTVELKDLPTFDGLLFQVDIDEEADAVVLTQVQMFFYPWDDDEEFEDVDAPDEGTEIA
ncbi:MAG: hypothetical protein ACR2IT_03225 [Pirellulales bacterium]